MQNRNDEIVIDFKRIICSIFQKAAWILAVSVACGVLTLGGTWLFITPKYEATAKFYVDNSSVSEGKTSKSLSSGDLTASRNLVDSCIVILNTRETLKDVIDYAQLDRTCESMEKMISADAVDNTEFFQVTVTGAAPRETEKIANAIVCILPERIAAIMEGTSVKVVEAAVVPTEPSSPSYRKNTLLGFLLGFVAVVGVVALREIFNATIRTEKDIRESCTCPVLTSVPDMTAFDKKGHFYGKKHPQAGQEPALIGGSISFAASEAYKRLRTKLLFSFSDESTCRVIGISSGLGGEGKSISAINLAYAFSELGRCVLLVDCDMRRPSLAQKLGIQTEPGLSNYLSCQSDLDALVQPCGIRNAPDAFHVIAAGPNPPNPGELLSSRRMKDTLQSLRRSYDYVILDLPPVGEVSDAMTIADQTDGILLVVRQNDCNRMVLEDAVRQFGFINAKLLGIVFNGTAVGTGKSYYKKHYERTSAATARD